MKQTLTWDKITTYYRKKPARFKAVQYTKGMEVLPPNVTCMPSSTHEISVVHLEDKINLIEDGDWLVRDLETGKTHILKDDVFNLVFEGI
jgi:hypothetical protein